MARGYVGWGDHGAANDSSSEEEEVAVAKSVSQELTPSAAPCAQPRCYTIITLQAFPEH